MIALKIKQIISAAAAMLIFGGCSSISESLDNYIEHDANIGKNAPAVNGTIGDIEAINEEAARTETKYETEEEKAAKAEKKRREELSKKADELIFEMTSEEKIGQLILARMSSDPVNDMAEYQYGGYTLYGDDFKNSDPEGISQLTAEIAEAAKIQPFFAVDEEGGTVVRVSAYSQYRDEPFSSPQLLFSRGGKELLEMDSAEKAKLLTSMGLNLNLAPVADISSDQSSYIYPRTMGQGPEGTAEGVAVMVKTAGDNGLASCIKHFPGYGENTDTHKDSAHDSRELYEFYNRDFVPFEAGITADTSKTPAIMVGHTIYDMIEADVPASLSPVIHEVLRDKLRFDGVVITDDLGMDAAKKYSSEQSVYVQAILADNDMLCVSEPQTAYSDLLSAYNDGVITDELLDAHVKRIIIMKLQYKIIT